MCGTDLITCIVIVYFKCSAFVVKYAFFPENLLFPQLLVLRYSSIHDKVIYWLEWWDIFTVQINFSFFSRKGSTWNASRSPKPLGRPYEEMHNSITYTRRGCDISIKYVRPSHWRYFILQCKLKYFAQNLEIKQSSQHLNYISDFWAKETNEGQTSSNRRGIWNETHYKRLEANSYLETWPPSILVYSKN